MAALPNLSACVEKGARTELMASYRNFDKALEEKRAKETGEAPVLVAFRLGGEDFMVAGMPGSVFFRAAALQGGMDKYDPSTPAGQAALERDGADLLAAFAGIFRDLLGEDHYPRLVDALGRSRMDVAEVYEFVQWLIAEASEAATARPTEPPSDSAESSSGNGTSSNLVSIGSDSTAPGS